MTPTRIIRAVRFEQRLGFRIEDHSLQLLRSALETGIIEMANPQRLAEEVKLAFCESSSLEVLSRLQKLGILRAIHPELRIDPKIQSKLELAEQFMKEHSSVLQPLSPHLVYFQLLALEMSEESREEIFERYSWTLTPWPISLQELLTPLRRPAKASEVAEILDQLNSEQLVVLASSSNQIKYQERLKNYLTKSRGMQALIRGQHILELGISQGPAVAKWKKRAFRAQQDGEFETTEDGIRWLSEQLTLRS